MWGGQGRGVSDAWNIWIEMRRLGSYLVEISGEQGRSLSAASELYKEIWDVRCRRKMHT